MATQIKERNETNIALYIIWFLAIINFLIGPSLVRWIKSQEFVEKPDGVLLDNVTSQGKSYIDGLNESPEHGVNKMKLWGWAFLTTDKLRSPDDYKRAIILISEKSQYTLEVTRVEREGVQTHFSDLNMSLIGSGFQAFFDINSILPGIYKISILFEDEKGQEILLMSNKYIEITHNSANLR
jgi:hypothetical protein